MKRPRRSLTSLLSSATVFPRASTSPTSGKENAPSGRTSAGRCRSGSFQTEIARISPGMTVYPPSCEGACVAGACACAGSTGESRSQGRPRYHNCLAIMNCPLCRPVYSRVRGCRHLRRRYISQPEFPLTPEHPDPMQPHLLPNRPKLSVIVPFFNEEESIQPLHRAIVAALEPLHVSFEMVFVNDGSHDDTLRIAVDVARRDPRVRVVNFRRNYGQTPAMAAGIEHARGEILVTMDGDLQNDPADIGLFLEKMDEGYDIVVGWRHNRQDKLISRKLPSRIANRLIGKVTGVPITDNGCSLKAYRASLIKQIPLYSEMHRFIPALASIAGPRIVEIKTVTSFTSRPLRWFSLLSAPLLVLATIAFGYCFVSLLQETPSLPLPVAGSGLIFFTSALVMVCGGALGELVYKLGDVRDLHFSRLSCKVRTGAASQ